MAKPESDSGEDRVDRLENHDELIEVFVDWSRGLRNKRTAPQETARLGGFTPEIAKILAREMKKSIQQEGITSFRNASKQPEPLQRARLAAKAKVAYNASTSLGEYHAKDRTEKDRS